MHHALRTTLTVLTLCVLLIGRAGGQVGPGSARARINFIANEGLLVLFGEENGVLIDALFRESVEPYAKIPQASLEHMETAQKPFDQVGLVLVTHKHSDHFSAASVARFMQSNTKARLVASPQVIDEVKAASPKYDAIAERVVQVAPTGTEAVTLEVEGIKVEVLALSHGSGELAEIANYGYIIHLGGKRMLHVGDAELNETTKAPLAKHAVGVDAACVPFWWLLEKEGREFMDKTLKPASTVAIHIPPAEVEAIAHKIHVYMPEVVVFTRPWSSKRL